MWSAYLFHVRSGNLGPRIELSKASWELTINETETFSCTVVKSSLPVLDSSLWLEPWWAGVALLWNNTPIFAGPIVGRPREDFFNMDLACKGIRAVLGERTVTADMTNWNNLTKKDYVANWSTDGQYNGSVAPNPVNSKFYNKTYASLARLSVEESLTKLGGDLPINFRVPIESFTDPTTEKISDRPHYRRIAGWEGISVDSVLTELSEVENGPDIMFRPVLKGTTIQWDMWTGRNDANPEIYQESDTIWDTTSQSGYISELEVQYTGTYMNNRVFVIGAGSGGAQPIRMAQNKTKLDQMFPLLENYISDPSSNAGKIEDKAASALAADDKARHQLNATVRVDGINQVGTFWPGEYGKLITSGWYGLRNGETRAKILSMSGDLSNNMQIGFKETEVI